MIEELGKEHGVYFFILALIASSKTSRIEIEFILEKNVGGYLRNLGEVYELIRKIKPFGAKASGRIQKYAFHCMQMAEVAQAGAFGAGAAGKMHPSGVFMPDPLKVNATLSYIKELSGEHIQMLHDIGGGAIVTMPTANDYENPKLKS